MVRELLTGRLWEHGLFLDLGSHGVESLGGDIEGGIGQVVQCGSTASGWWVAIIGGSFLGAGVGARPEPLETGMRCTSTELQQAKQCFGWRNPYHVFLSWDSVLSNTFALELGLFCLCFPWDYWLVSLIYLILWLFSCKDSNPSTFFPQTWCWNLWCIWSALSQKLPYFLVLIFSQLFFLLLWQTCQQ